MSDVERTRIQELRCLLGDCVQAMRVAQPQMALPPAREVLERVARAAELALMHPEAGR